MSSNIRKKKKEKKRKTKEKRVEHVFLFIQEIQSRYITKG